MYRRAERQMERFINRQKDGRTYEQIDIQIEGNLQSGIYAERQPNIGINRQTYTQTDR